MIDGSVTDAGHAITLTADGTNRHYGLKGQGVVIDNGASALPAVSVFDDFVTVEWMEVTGGGGTADGVRVNLLSPGDGSLVQVRNNLIRNVTGDGVALYDGAGRVDVINNIVHGCVTAACSGVWLNSGSLAAGSRFRVLNNTIYGNASGIAKNPGASAAATLLLRNNISFGSTSYPNYEPDPLDSLDPASSHNLSEDATAFDASPAGNDQSGVTLAQVAFYSTTVGSENLHIRYSSVAREQGADLSSIFGDDIDTSPRPGGALWDKGADETIPQTNYRSVGVDSGNLNTGGRTVGDLGHDRHLLRLHAHPRRGGRRPAVPGDRDLVSGVHPVPRVRHRLRRQERDRRHTQGRRGRDGRRGLSRLHLALELQALSENQLRHLGQELRHVPGPRRERIHDDGGYYNDGPMSDMVDVTGWTTGPSNYIRIYTPVSGYEVGASQRHNGTAGTGFRLTPVATGASYQVINLDTGYVRVEGLEIDGSGLTNALYVRGIRVSTTLSNVGDIRMDGCVIHDLHTTRTAMPKGRWGSSTFRRPLRRVRR